jgi:hypothetical protein
MYIDNFIKTRKLIVGFTFSIVFLLNSLAYAELSNINLSAFLKDEEKVQRLEQALERDRELALHESLYESTYLSQSPYESGGSCSIVSTIEGPSNDIQGLAYDSGNLWLSLDSGMIVKIDLQGNMLSSFVAPGQSFLGPAPMGLAYDDTYLWSVDFLDEKIYKLTKSGGVVSSISAPSGIPSGLAWDGNNLWVSEWYSYKIYKINPLNGNVLSSFNAPDFGIEFPYGLAWDGTHLWSSNSNGIYMLDTNTGSVLSSCSDDEFLYGKAYGMTWDGAYLWTGGWIDRYINKVRTYGGCTYSISPLSQSFSSSGGTGSVSVTTQSGCSWNATSNASWITIISGNSGSGNGTVLYSAAANTGSSSRTGTMTIAGQTFTVTQEGTIINYSISGTVTLIGTKAPLSGVTMTLSGAATATTTTDSNGFYQFSVLANGTYTVTPSKSGYRFFLRSRNVTVNGSNVILNFKARAL